jgi:hypothetical protein
LLAEGAKIASLALFLSNASALQIRVNPFPDDVYSIISFALSFLSLAKPIYPFDPLVSVFVMVC